VLITIAGMISMSTFVLEGAVKVVVVVVVVVVVGLILNPLYAGLNLYPSPVSGLRRVTKLDYSWHSRLSDGLTYMYI